MKIIIRVMDRISHHFLSDWTHPKRKPVVYVKWPLYFKLEKKRHLHGLFYGLMVFTSSYWNVSFFSKYKVLTGGRQTRNNSIITASNLPNKMMMFKSSHRKDTKNYVKLNIVNLDFNVSIWRVFRHTGKELELTEKTWRHRTKKSLKTSLWLSRLLLALEPRPKYYHERGKGGYDRNFSFFLFSLPSLNF